MPRVEFTSHLRRFVPVPSQEVAGTTVREALDGAFAANPRLRGYIVDDQGRLRQHVVVFVDGERAALDAAVGTASEVVVMQALSGG